MYFASPIPSSEGILTSVITISMGVLSIMSIASVPFLAVAETTQSYVSQFIYSDRPFLNIVSSSTINK
ncbi:unknown [Eubacterium sp. CAG:156]|nr:unknown [Eubacterium sp. CAG:156]